jgi:RimJ/RimL family protein N-acetyltransferase
VTAFHVRRATAGDVDAIVRLYDELAHERRWVASEPPIDCQRYREGLMGALDDPYKVVLVAESDGAVIGELAAFGRANRPADIGMSVTAEWRGRGVGTTLMQTCVDWARERGIHKLALQVWPHNDAALRLYEKFGFEREGLLRAHYRRQSGDLWDAIVMGLLLE